MLNCNSWSGICFFISLSIVHVQQGSLLRSNWWASRSINDGSLCSFQELFNIFKTQCSWSFTGKIIHISTEWNEHCKDHFSIWIAWFFFKWSYARSECKILNSRFIRNCKNSIMIIFFWCFGPLWITWPVQSLKYFQTKCSQGWFIGTLFKPYFHGGLLCL